MEKKAAKQYTFFEDVFAVARLIPFGRVSTYGHIAQYLGSKQSARMVGWAMNAAHHVEPKVPAHRVVNRKGLLTGKHHFESPNAMQDELLKEGIEVKNDQVQQFQTVLWDPSEELKIT